MRILIIELERHESGGDRCYDGWMRIRHGIQEVTAYSVVLFNIDQDDSIILFRPVEGVVPIMQPNDCRFVHRQSSFHYGWPFLFTVATDSEIRPSRS